MLHRGQDQDAAFIFGADEFHDVAAGADRVVSDAAIDLGEAVAVLIGRRGKPGEPGLLRDKVAEAAAKMARPDRWDGALLFVCPQLSEIWTPSATATISTYTGLHSPLGCIGLPHF